MGKSFNDDVFNNTFNLDSINGLNISREAIEENKHHETPNIDLSKIDLDEAKKEMKQAKKPNIVDEVEQLQEQVKRYEQPVENNPHSLVKKNNIKYTKKTMIFNQDYLDIINGLANINDMQIKDVLNQLLERAINDLDDKVRDKALKNGRKARPTKQEKSIF